jgi:hypothetical protein
VGDGAMQMNNMAELITVAKYWRDWQDPRWIVCVFNNEDLNQVTWEQRIINADPKFDASQKIPNVSYAGFAAMIGLHGIFVDHPEQVGHAWDQALASTRPVVLEIKTDPEVPPLSPHITLQQAKNFSIALAKGDPDEVGVIRGTARQVLETILPTRRSNRKDARIPGAQFYLKVRQWICNPHCWIVVRALDGVRCHRWQRHKKCRERLDRKYDPNRSAGEVFRNQSNRGAIRGRFERDESTNFKVSDHLLRASRRLVLES